MHADHCLIPAFSYSHCPIKDHAKNLPVAIRVVFYLSFECSTFNSLELLGVCCYAENVVFSIPLL